MGSPTGDYMKQIPISFFFPYSFIIIQSLSSLLINFILIATPEKKIIKKKKNLTVSIRNLQDLQHRFSKRFNLGNIAQLN